MSAIPEMQVDADFLSAVLNHHAGRKDALISVLQEIQKRLGYLPKETLIVLGRKTGIPLSRIYSIATFYAQFSLVPKGRHTIRICRGTACHVQGGRAISTTIEETLGVRDGETTGDRAFTLESVACLGTCFLAPVMMVDDSYHGQLDSQRAIEIIGRLAKSEGDPP